MINDITLESHGVRVTFEWAGDRYTHRVVCTDGILESLEYAGIETPVFSDAHQQGDLLFFSGMSGDRHWSMSVEPSTKGLTMDIACRVKSAIKRIGSLYQSTGQITVIPEQIEGAPSCEILSPDKDHLEIMPSNISSEPPMTLRYRYRVEP